MRTPKSLIYSLLLVAVLFLAALAVLSTRGAGGNSDSKKEAVAIGYPEMMDVLLRSS